MRARTPDLEKTTAGAVWRRPLTTSSQGSARPQADDAPGPAVRSVPAAGQHLQGDNVPGLHVLQRAAQLLARACGLAVHRHDDVRSAVIVRGQQAPVRRAVGRDFADDQSATVPQDRPQPRIAGVLLGERLDRDAQDLFLGARLAAQACPRIRGDPRFVLRGRAAELDRDRLALAALAHDGDLDRLAGPLEPDPLLQLRDVLDRLAVERDDHVAGLDPRVLGGRVGRVGRVVVHHDALRLLQAHQVRVFGVDRPDGDAHHGSLHVPALDQLLHHRAGEVDGNGEAVARVEPGLARDRRVDAYHLAMPVHEPSPRGARLDGRVALDDVLDGVARLLQAAQQPSLGAPDPGRD